LPACLLFTAYCLLSTALAAAAGEDWKVQREYRRVLGGIPREDTVVFSFCDGGHPTADLVVLDSAGNRLPTAFLWGKHGGTTWIAVGTSKAQGDVAVYYGGGTGGGGPSPAWTPKLSLLLYTIPIPPGALEKFNPIAAGFKRENLYGIGFVDKIWHGANPFGPDTHFASGYIGYLNIEHPGQYKIFTASCDASYVLLDGKPLVSWPGTHDVGGGLVGQHNASIHLNKGQYKIEYYHAVAEGEPFMILGWTPPGEKGYKLVPDNAYWHTPKVKAGPPERRGGGAVAAFEWVQVDQLLHDKDRPGHSEPASHAVKETPKEPKEPKDHKGEPKRDPAYQFTHVSFTSQCRDLATRGKVFWDYGDGVRAELSATEVRRAAEHIYAGKGPFTCTVRVAGEDGKELDRYAGLVSIEPMEKNWTIQDEKAVKEYVADIVASDCSAAPAHVMDAYWELVETEENVERIAPFLETYVTRFGARGSSWFPADRLALLVSVKNPARALKLYTELAAAATTPLEAARCHMERIEIMLHKLKDPAKALAEAERLKATGNCAEVRRIAAVKMGDVYRAQGDFEKAEAAYRAVQQITYTHVDKRAIPVRQGGFLETAAAHVQTGHLRAARDALVLWVMEDPIGNLSGDLPLMTAKYFDKLGEPDRALAELETIVKVNPLSPYLPDIELLMSRAYKKKNDYTKARQLYDKVLREYPNSRAAKQGTHEGF